ncbi:MAG: L-threonylcarbamoyladenylate synthase [Cellulosilyticaceae bacterium]
MNTLMITDTTQLTTAAHIIQDGGLVATPTETVYGLCANALNEAAVADIFKAKGRPNDNPLIIHISSLEMLTPLITHIPPSAKVLMEHFWPGPLTLIFEASSLVPLSVRAGLPSVAIRFPSHPIMQQLITESGLPIAAPSANTSGKPSPTNAFRVKEDLYGKIDAIIDGGSSEVGLESTVVDVTGEVPTILRPGGITKEMLEQVLGNVIIDPALASKDPTLVPKSPGMKYTHYSPNAEVIIVKGSEKDVINEINLRIQAHLLEGKRVGVLATDETKDAFGDTFVLSLGSIYQLDGIATHLFESLRTFDDYKVDIVYSLAFPENGIGGAIMNRLEKSAGFNIIHKHRQNC